MARLFMYLFRIICRIRDNRPTSKKKTKKLKREWRNREVGFGGIAISRERQWKDEIGRMTWGQLV